MNLLDSDIYTILGEEGFTRLVSAFYRRVATDDILMTMYPRHVLPGAEQRGHPRLRMRHAGFHIDRRARDRWVMLMEQALEEADLPAQAAPILRQFFHDSGTFLINRET
jgi:hemoglobin